MLARHLDHAAIAPASARSGDLAAKARAPVRPDHHRAAVTTDGCIGLDGRAGRDERHLSVAERGVLPAEAAADAHIAATRRARGVDLRPVDRHAVAQQFDASAALTGHVGRGIDRAPRLHHIGMHLHRPCADAREVVDGDGVDIAAGEHRTALTERLRVLGELLCAHARIHMPAALADENLVTSHERDNIPRLDRAEVRHVLAEQVNRVGVDRAVVDDIALQIREAINALEEVGIGDRTCRGVDRCSVDNRVLTEDHARRVGDVHPAIGGQRAIDVRRRSAVDAVEDARGRTGLNEAHRLVRRDIKARVVDDRAVRRVDGRHRSIAAEGRRARSDARALGVSQRGRGQQGHQRADGQPATDACSQTAVSLPPRPPARPLTGARSTTTTATNRRL